MSWYGSKDSRYTLEMLFYPNRRNGWPSYWIPLEGKMSPPLVAAATETASPFPHKVRREECAMTDPVAGVQFLNTSPPTSSLPIRTFPRSVYGAP